MEPNLTTITNNVKEELNQTYALINQHMVTFYSKRILRITLEVICYVLSFVALIIALFNIDLALNGQGVIDGKILFVKLEGASLQKVENVIKVITLIAGVLFLILGLYIRNVRRHHEKVRHAAIKLNDIIKKISIN